MRKNREEPQITTTSTAPNDHGASETTRNPTESPLTGGVVEGKQASRSKKPVLQRNPKDHNENWDTLLPQFEISLSHPKIRALMFEAKDLSVVTSPYAGSMLLRTILEFALFQRLKMAGKYSSVREMYFEQQKSAGRALTDEQKKTFRPLLAVAMEWLNKNDDFFPTDVRRECITARNKFGAHLKELNGVVHEGDLIDSGKLKIIRNDAVPLLRFLLSG